MCRQDFMDNYIDCLDLLTTIQFHIIIKLKSGFTDPRLIIRFILVIILLINSYRYYIKPFIYH